MLKITNLKVELEEEIFFGELLGDKLPLLPPICVFSPVGVYPQLSLLSPNCFTSLAAAEESNGIKKLVST